MDKTIPTKVNRYNLYNAGNRLLGTGEELALPDFEALSESVAGAGVLGEFSDPTVGYFSDQTLDIPFRVFDEEAADMIDMVNPVHLEIRSATQSLDSEGTTEFHGLRVVVRGKANKIAIGKLKAGNGMDSAITLSLTYIRIERDGKEVLELDKINIVYRVNGVDMLEKIKELT